jgi:hypothetical protein
MKKKEKKVVVWRSVQAAWKENKEKNAKKKPKGGAGVRAINKKAVIKSGWGFEEKERPFFFFLSKEEDLVT